MNSENRVSVLSRQAIRRLDQRAIDEFGVPGVVLMENAGRGVADTLCDLGITGPVVICCGKGNNGGDGFVIARHLDLRGHQVTVVCWDEFNAWHGDAGINAAILSRSGVKVVRPIEPGQLRSELSGAGWVVDALLGTGATGDPRPPYDDVIDQLNSADARRLAVDIPSGLDCDTGAAGRPTFRADHTCSFVAAKPGLLAADATSYVGQLHILDIGAPRRLVAQMLADQ